jgi:hypothetical protein
MDVRRFSDIVVSIEGKGFESYDSGKQGCTVLIVKAEE